MVFLFFLLTGLIFAAPLENFGDGTEFALSTSFLGISHPPSYPLYVLLSKVLYYLPLGNVAYKLNIFSSIVGALAAYLAFRLNKGDFVERFFLALILFFSRSFFFNTFTGEVYSLNLLFFIIILFLTEKWADKRYFYATLFLLGLGVGNHHTLLFLVIYFAYLVISKKFRFEFADYATSIMFFILGFSVYLYLPIRAMTKPVWNWGNPTNVWLFINSFFRRDFKPEGFGRDIETLFSQLLTFNPFYEFGIFAGFVILVAFFVVFFKDKKRFCELFLLVFLYSFFIIILLGKDTLSIEERKDAYAVFFIPAYFMLISSTQIAFKDCDKKLKSAIFLVLTIFVIYNNRDIVRIFLNHDGLYFSHDFAKAELSSLPNNATLIVEGGEKDFPLFYQQLHEKFRTDVKIIKLATLGKKWNFKESLEVGTTYIKGYEGEKTEKLKILKAVVLFQKDFKNKRVFFNFFNKAELPETLDYTANGMFYEYGEGNKVTLDFIRNRSLDESPTAFEEVVKHALEGYKKSNDVEEVKRAEEILKRLSDK